MAAREKSDYFWSNLIPRAMNASLHWWSVFLRQVLLLGCFVGGGLTAMAQERAGCEDHSLITRYPGSVIGWCNEQTYHTYDIVLGRLIAKGVGPLLPVPSNHWWKSFTVIDQKLAPSR